MMTETMALLRERDSLRWAAPRRRGGYENAEKIAIDDGQFFFHSCFMTLGDWAGFSVVQNHIGPKAKQA